MKPQVFTLVPCESEPNYTILSATRSEIFQEKED